MVSPNFWHCHGQKLSWWRHQIKTFSVLLAICAGNSPVTGEFPAHRPVTRSFDVFFDLHLNKRLSKQSWCWWFEALSHPLWHHNNDAPSFANTFMANLKDEVLHKAKCKPLVMFRFIDDIFFIWTHSKDELTECINLYNSHNEPIKIDYRYNINGTSDFFGRHNLQKL